MKRVLALAGGLALAFTMSACGASTGPVGTWGNGYNTDKQPYLQLAVAQQTGGVSAGYLSGSDGCNRIVGQWAVQDADPNVVQLQHQANTKTSCDGIDTWLSGAAGAKIDGNKMTITDSKGATIGVLDRRS